MLCAVKAPVVVVRTFAHESPEHEALTPVPVSVQLVTLVAFHVISDVLPECTRTGLTLMLSSGSRTVTAMVVLFPEG